MSNQALAPAEPAPSFNLCTYGASIPVETATAPRYKNPLASELGLAVGEALGLGVESSNPLVETARYTLAAANVDNPSPQTERDARVVLWSVTSELLGRDPGFERPQLPSLKQPKPLDEAERAAALKRSRAADAAEAQRTITMAERTGNPDAAAFIRRVLRQTPEPGLLQ